MYYRTEKERVMALVEARQEDIAICMEDFKYAVTEEDHKKIQDQIDEYTADIKRALESFNNTFEG